MRLAISVLALILASLFLAFGVVRQTILRPAEFSSKSFLAQPINGLLVVDARVINRYLAPGLRAEVSLAAQNPNQVESFDREAGIYLAQADDLRAWLSGFEYDRALVDGEGKLAAQAEGRTMAGAKIPPLARNNDLFIFQKAPGPGGVLDYRTPKLNDANLLIQLPLGSDGRSIEAKVEIRWELSKTDTWVLPALIIGIALLIFALIFYYWPGLRARLGRIARRRTFVSSRARKKRGRGRRARLLVALPALALLVAGCAGGGSSEPSPSLSSIGVDNLRTSMGVSQANKILSRLISGLHAADAAKSVEIVRQVAEGQVLEDRQAAYKILQKKSDASIELLSPDPRGGLQLLLPERTTGWPRSALMVVGSATGSSGQRLAPLVMYIKQNSPRENYRISFLLYLRSNAVIPPVPSEQVGGLLIPPDSKLIRVSPNALASEYAKYIADPNALSSLFEAGEQSPADQIRQDRLSKERALAGRGRISFSTQSGPSAAFATSDAGALVLANMNEVETVRANRGFEVSPQSGGAVNLLSGINSTTSGMETVYNDQLLFYVPPVSSDKKVVLLGYAHSLVSARGLN